MEFEFIRMCAHKFLEGSAVLPEATTQVEHTPRPEEGCQILRQHRVKGPNLPPIVPAVGIQTNTTCSPHGKVPVIGNPKYLLAHPD